MKVIYQKYGLLATVDGHLAEVIQGHKVVWFGNVPLETTPKDVLEMFLAQQKSLANSN